jgi:lipoprotein-anchoring transpeptidase ErfK/SrfK
MLKLSMVFTGALVAAAALFVDWATAAPLSSTHSMMRADQMAPVEEQTEQGFEMPAHLKRQVVAYQGSEAAGTVIIDTANTHLYFVMGGGKAMRYGIGVGRDGFRWSGVQSITKKAEWPDWTPPPEMIARQPYLPRFMAGGATNPLGARAMYLGGTVYRIHGTNAPSTIGSRVSSGCIRLTNDDVADLYSRVNVGTKVIVLNGESRAEAPARPLVSAPVSLRSGNIY